MLGPDPGSDFQGHILLTPGHYDALLTPEIEVEMQKHQELKVSKEDLIAIVRQYQSQSWLAWFLSLDLFRN